MAQPTPPPLQQAPPAYPNLPTRQSTQPPPFSIGIAAGAEDVKYQAKYKDLKRKVKEIEADNDKLHFKVLQAKRSIQRMKLERAILYERLQQVPPSPELQDRHPLPPVHQPPPHQHHALPPNHIPRDIDRTPPEYIRSHAGPHGRNPPIDSPIAPAALPHSTRRGSAGGPDARQLQYVPHMPPVPQDPHRGHHTSPHMPHPNASHERARSPSRGRGHPAPGTYHPHPPQQYADVQQHPLHSPPSSERDRPRRHELHELTPSHARPQMPPHSPPRVHNHQRLGPGTYINREDMLDPQRDRDREREWERERERGRATREMHSPPVHRMRPAEYAETHAAPVPRRREEQTSYFATDRRAGYSRSNSVGSASGSGSVVGERDRERDRDAPPSRPDSRSAFYEPDRTRSFRLRPVQPQEEVDFVHEDGRPKSRDRNGSSGGGGAGGGGGGAYAPEQSRPPHDSRKRSRNDMDVDDADDGPPGAMYGRHSDKRYHPAS